MLSTKTFRPLVLVATVAAFMLLAATSIEAIPTTPGIAPHLFPGSTVFSMPVGIVSHQITIHWLAPLVRNGQIAFAVAHQATTAKSSDAPARPCAGR
ncbi:hypothetical protein BGX23_008192, partial [Mortierella sp. AD031]